MKRVCIRLISIFLVLLTMMSMVSMVFADDEGMSAGSANSRIKTYINLAKGEAVVNADLTNLTADQLRFLGVWLSNFYVPFGTELGGAGGKYIEQNKLDMKTALCDNLNFSEELSATLVEEILGRARSSATQLKVRVTSDPWYKGYKPETALTLPNSEFSAFSENMSYYDFFRLMIGEYRDVFKYQLCFFNDAWSHSYKNFLWFHVVDHIKSQVAWAFYTAYSNGDWLSKIVPPRLNYGEYPPETELGSVVGTKPAIGYLAMLHSYGDSFTNASGSKESKVNTFNTKNFVYIDSDFKPDNRSSSDGIYVRDNCKFDKNHRYYYVLRNDYVAYLIDLNEWVNYYTSFEDTNYDAISAEDFNLMMHQAAITAYKQMNYYEGNLECYYSGDKLWTNQSIVKITENRANRIDFYYKLFSDDIDSHVNYFRTMYFGFEDEEGNFIPVADCALEKNLWTPSQMEFMKCLEAVLLRDGYGFSLSDFTESDTEDIEKLKAFMTRWGGDWNQLMPDEKEVMYESTVFGSRVYVDCFGDLIYMGGNHQYIIMPGCMNPYMWQSVREDGSDYGPVNISASMSNARNIAQAEKNQFSGYINNFIKYKPETVMSNINNDWFIQTYLCYYLPGEAQQVIDDAIEAVNEMTDEELEFYQMTREEALLSWTPQTRVDQLNRLVSLGIGNLGYQIDGLAIDNGYDRGYADGLNIVFFGDVKYKEEKDIKARLVRGNSEVATFNTDSNLLETVLGAGTDKMRNWFAHSQAMHSSTTGANGLSLSGWRLYARQGNNSTDLCYLCGPDDWFDLQITAISNKSEDSYSTSNRDCPASTAQRRPEGEKNSVVLLMTGFVFMDTLGVYNDGYEDYNLFNIASFLNDDCTSNAQNKVGAIDGEAFQNGFARLESGKMMFPSDNPALYASLYVTYCFAGLYDEDKKAETIGRLGYRMAPEHFPGIPSTGIDVELEDIEIPDYELENIKHWTYYLLHPTDGFRYVRTLISNKLNRLLLGWHSDMVGSNGVGATTGTTRYRSNVGYVSMPDLSELNWTSKLVNFYNRCIPFIIIAIVVLMLLAFITGALSLQHAFFAAVLFSAFLLLPTTLINGAVQYSNLISQRVYGDKFIYWAMVQQETYAQAIDEAANMPGSSGESTYDNYLRTLYGENQAVYSNQGNESIILKWQAPKKMASVMLSQQDAGMLSGLGSMRPMLMGMLSNAYSGQSYLDGDDSVYMYRSYLDIANFSRYIYRGIRDGRKASYSPVLNYDNFKDASGNYVFDKSYVDYLMDNVYELSAYSVDMKGAQFYDTLAREYDYNNFNNRYSTTSYPGVSDSAYIYKLTPIQSKIINDALSVKGKLNTFDSLGDLIPLNRDLFNFGIPMFTNSTTSFDPEWFISTAGIPPETDGRTAQESRRAAAITTDVSKYTTEDFTSLAAYSLYSENVFYYFSWGMYDWGKLNCDSSLTQGYFKDMILGREDGGFFYSKGSTIYTNAQASNELKDFMDMRSLFTYIIPYMKNCNDLVREWDDIYGISIYEGVPTEEGLMSEMTTPELKQRYWHNLNVARLYGLYCPWVDLMYDCSYADSETITVLGRRVTIDDPLNPASYPADRPMIFSRAEMVDMGLGEGDLTKAERLILKCNDQMQERVYDLLNYYNFSDVTLDTAAAMQCAFVFNRVFSEPSVLNDNKNIYPQSFDLANFSYDAFLRMILANTTNESLLETAAEAHTVNGVMTGDFYERIVGRSSLTTILVMLILDFLSIYVLPAFKIFFLIAAFLSSIAIVFVSVCRIEENAKFIRKVGAEFLMPLLQFFATTVGFSLVISLFMGTGNNAVTQTDQLTISFGDPVVVMLIMIALDVAVIIIYWKIIKKVLSSMKLNFKMMGNFASGVIGGAAGLALGAVGAAVAAGKRSANGAVESARYHHRNRLIKKGQGGSGDGSGAALEPGQEGTGSESPRAAQRAAGGRDSVAGASGNGDSGGGSGSSGASGTDAETMKPNEPAGKKPEEIKKATDDIDSKAETGMEKLEQQRRKSVDTNPDKDKAMYGSDRTAARTNATNERDFGHAMGDDGKVDTSKLSAKERYKYESRMSRSQKTQEAQCASEQGAREVESMNQAARREKYKQYKAAKSNGATSAQAMRQARSSESVRNIEQQRDRRIAKGGVSNGKKTAAEERSKSNGARVRAIYSGTPKGASGRNAAGTSRAPSKSGSAPRRASSGSKPAMRSSGASMKRSSASKPKKSSPPPKVKPAGRA